MANVPFPIAGETLEEVRYQIYELIRTLFEEKIGGADLGDVFSIVGDVLTLVLAGSSGLTKSGNELAIDPYSTGGLAISANGVAIKVNADGGLETTASGAGILLDGATLTLSSSGLKLTAASSLGEITLDNDGLHILDTDDSHDLIISPGSDLSADRVLTLTTGDAARTITLSGNPTLADWFNQAVKSTSSPTFDNLNLTGYQDITEVADPGAPAAGVVRLFASSEGTGDHIISICEGDHWHDLSAAGGAVNSNVHVRIEVTDAGGLNITWAAGEIYDAFASDMKDSTVTIAAQAAAQAQTANAMNYLYYDQSATALAQSSSEDDIDWGDGDFPVYACATTTDDIFYTDHFKTGDKDLHNIKHVLWHALKTMVSSGLVVSEHAGANAFDIDCTAGTFIHLGIDVHNVLAIDTTATNIMRWFHDAGNAWSHDDNSQIDAANWDDDDDGAAATGNGAAKYYRSTFYTDGTRLHWVYPQVEYDTLNQALVAVDPTPPGALYHFPKLMALVMKGDAAALPAAGSNRWIDSRPILGTATGGGNISDHGNLAGLSDDDHAQYLLVTGTRDATGLNASILLSNQVFS